MIFKINPGNKKRRQSCLWLNINERCMVQELKPILMEKSSFSYVARVEFYYDILNEKQRVNVIFNVYFQLALEYIWLVSFPKTIVSNYEGSLSYVWHSSIFLQSSHLLKSWKFIFWIFMLVRFFKPFGNRYAYSWYFAHFVG